MRRSACILLATAATLLTASPASANTVVIGSNFQGTIEQAVFDGGAASVANLALPSPMIAASPTDGTVVSWRMTGDPNHQFTPQIIRASGGNYFAAASGPASPGVGATTVVEYPLSLPIRKGDFFGYSAPINARSGVIDRTGSSYGYFAPPLGGTAVAPTSASTNVEEALAATVRFCLVPKLKGKKPKQAKKALKAADCKFGGKKKSKQRRKKKKVVGQTAKPGTSISDTAPVSIKVSRPTG